MIIFVCIISVSVYIARKKISPWDWEAVIRKRKTTEQNTNN